MIYIHRKVMFIFTKFMPLFLQLKPKVKLKGIYLNDNNMFKILKQKSP